MTVIPSVVASCIRSSTIATRDYYVELIASSNGLRTVNAHAGRSLVQQQQQLMRQSISPLDSCSRPDTTGSTQERVRGVRRPQHTRWRPPRRRNGLRAEAFSRHRVAVIDQRSVDDCRHSADRIDSRGLRAA